MKALSLSLTFAVTLSLNLRIDMNSDDSQNVLGRSEYASESGPGGPPVRVSELKKVGATPTKKRGSQSEPLFLWALTDSNRRPSACKADALNQLS